MTLREAEKKAVIAGTEDSLKILPDSYATDAQGRIPGRVGRYRAGRITLAISQPALIVQTPVNVRGCSLRLMAPTLAMQDCGAQPG